MGKKSFRACPARKMSIHTTLSLAVTPSSCHSHKACWEAWFPGRPRGTFPWRRFRMQRKRTLACTSGVAISVPIVRPQAEQSNRDRFGGGESLMQGGGKTQLNKNDSRAYIWMKRQLRWELTLATSNCSSMNFVGFVLQLVRILQSLVWQRTYWELQQLSGYLFSVINELSSFTLIVWIKISHTHTLSKDPHTLS